MLLLRRAAKDNWEQICFVVRSTYGLSPVDPNWLNMTQEQILKEYYILKERNRLLSGQPEEYVDDNFDEWDKATDEAGEYVDPEETDDESGEEE